jgi:hypothetical protein
VDLELGLPPGYVSGSPGPCRRRPAVPVRVGGEPRSFGLIHCSSNDFRRNLVGPVPQPRSDPPCDTACSSPGPM